MVRSLNTLLIANRGEIACRIIQSAKARGLTCVAVYSDADADARHVALADRAIHIGAAAPADSYLNADRILAAAQTSGADAIHPGYGFLSENADFADAVAQAGLVFVGPSATSIRAMGLKDHAKALMEQAGVPIVPGYHGADQDPATLAKHADTIGYPVLIKAVAGGGGKGMRLVETAPDFASALASARAEAKTAFGNDAVLIEKFITAPRHIEVQVFGDGTNVVHLFERDCSLQRRHQKVIEEAPAPDMPDDVRAAMCGAAVKAAQAIDYSGAGTVEFIVDGSGPLRTDGFWFMEMNTRLQVEHPVTEAITGIDLVDWQLRIAAGHPIPMAQNDITMTGHAFEARLYAEDATAGFLPAIGTLSHLTFPDGARSDTGVRAGDTITPHYDPMIAKVITSGDTRAQALENLGLALAGTQIAGTVTNLGFLNALARHPDVMAGRVDTGLIGRDLESLCAPPIATDRDLAQAAVEASGLADAIENSGTDTGGGVAGFALHAPLTWTVDIEDHTVRLTPMGDHIACVVNDKTVIAKKHSKSWTYGGVFMRPSYVDGHTITLFGAAPITLTMPDPLARAANEAAGDMVVTPMPGMLRDVHVAVGDTVAAGDPLAVLEAMKMEHVLRAPRDGKIASLNARAGQQVQAGLTLMTLEDGS